MKALLVIDDPPEEADRGGFCQERHCSSRIGPGKGRCRPRVVVQKGEAPASIWFVSLIVMTRALCLFVCLGVIVGCAGVTRVKSGSGSQLAVEGRTYDDVWRAAVKIVSQHLSISVGTNKERGEIQAEGGGGRFSPDQVVGVFIQPANAQSDRYMVEVVSRNRGSVPLIGRNWEQTIIDGLKTELKL